VKGHGEDTVDLTKWFCTRKKWIEHKSAQHNQVTTEESNSSDNTGPSPAGSSLSEFGADEKQHFRYLLGLGEKTNP
jgi:hypothetical protein